MPQYRQKPDGSLRPVRTVDERLAAREKELHFRRVGEELRRLRAADARRRRRREAVDESYRNGPGASAPARARLTESSGASYDYGDWLEGYADILDRASGPNEYALVLSVANDRRYGDNWPFWRTWIEHSRLRASSRLAYGMFPLIRGTIANVGAYVIGDGMRTRAAARVDECPRPLLDAVQAWLDEWEADNDWLALQLECFTRYERDGEFFVRLFPQSDGRTHARLVDPTQVVDRPGVDAAVGKYGVLTDPEDLWDVRGYWVSYDGSGAGEEVPATLMRGLLNNVDRGIKRGCPTVAYEMLKYFRSAGKLLENMGVGAAIQSAIAFVRQHETAAGDVVADYVEGGEDYDQRRLYGQTYESVRRIEAGTVMDIDAGQQFVDTKFSANVQNFTAVVQALLRAVGVHYGAPEWITSADSSNNNFASSLTAEAPFVKRCKQHQARFEQIFRWAVRESLRHFCRRKGGVKAQGRRWLYDELERFVDVQVTPPTVETRDRQQEVQLNQALNQMGIKSPQTIAQEMDLDPDKEAINIKQWKKDHPELDPNAQQGMGGLGGMLGAMGGPESGGMEGSGAEAAPGAGAMGEEDAGAVGGEGQGGGLDDAGLADGLADIMGGGEADGQQDEYADEYGDADTSALDDAGLGDLFAGLGLDGGPDEYGDEYEGGPDEYGDEFGDEFAEDAPSGPDFESGPKGMKALQELQAAVYAGEIPREAAIQSAVLTLGFSMADAQKLFPDTPPEDMGGGEDEGGDFPPRNGPAPPADPKSPAGVMEFVESVVSGGRGLADLLEGRHDDKADGAKWQTGSTYWKKEGGRARRISKAEYEGAGGETRGRTQAQPQRPSDAPSVRGLIDSGDHAAAAEAIGRVRSLSQLRALARELGLSAKDRTLAGLAKKAADEIAARVKSDVDTASSRGSVGASPEEEAPMKRASKRKVDPGEIAQAVRDVHAQGGVSSQADVDAALAGLPSLTQTQLDSLAKDLGSTHRGKPPKRQLIDTVGKLVRGSRQIAARADLADDARFTGTDARGVEWIDGVPQKKAEESPADAAAMSAVEAAKGRTAPGITYVTDVIDELQKEDPALSKEDAQAALLRLQKAGLLTLQLVNDPHLDPHAAKGGIATDRGVRGYVVPGPRAAAGAKPPAPPADEFRRIAADLSGSTFADADAFGESLRGLSRAEVRDIADAVMPRGFAKGAGKSEMIDGMTRQLRNMLFSHQRAASGAQAVDDFYARPTPPAVPELPPAAQGHYDLAASDSLPAADRLKSAALLDAVLLTGLKRSPLGHTYGVGAAAGLSGFRKAAGRLRDEIADAPASRRRAMIDEADAAVTQAARGAAAGVEGLRRMARAGRVIQLPDGSEADPAAVADAYESLAPRMEAAARAEIADAAAGAEGADKGGGWIDWLWG